eukprot:TRINITY_DN2382_c0_g2_i10.p2 TRINITY_DN2382_c0_g2~~TRINITY_DN2382_c0_g2_i10.p2  ORF type:complete len:410 (+),score=87.77 TRINITY_DN2382_c0_g2_i10:1968-3197(+)
MSLAKCWTRVHPIMVKRASMCTIWDTDDKEYIDCAAGIATVNTGHCHPHVVEAIRRQAGEVIHAQVNAHPSNTLVKYAARLKAWLPEGMDSLFFCNSGAEAVEGTAKLIRAATGREAILGMSHAFHGRTSLAMTLTTSGSKYRPHHSPCAPGIHQVNRPTSDAEVDMCKRQLADFSSGVLPWSQVSGVVLEPILGEGGFAPQRPAWMTHLREQCAENGALFVADEIQSGFWRCGKMWGFQHFPDVAEPDVVIFGKGIAGGMPFAGFAASSKLMDALQPGNHGGTFGGNAVCAAAADAVLDIISEKSFEENISARGAQFYKGLMELHAKYPHVITEVRGEHQGLMIGFDLNDTIKAKAFVHAMREDHSVLMFAPCGNEGRTLRLMPPLVITEDECARVLDAAEGTCAKMA